MSNKTGRKPAQIDTEGGPGTYDEHRYFDDNVKVHEFGQRRESKLDLTPGPGSYEHHTRSELVNNSSPKWNWRGQSPRKSMKADPEGGPGTYEEHRRFDDNAKVHEFGQRRESKLDFYPGPGSYEHHLRSEMRNNSSPSWKWKGQSPRKRQTIDTEGGPGTYEEHRRFNDNVKGGEFGHKRNLPLDVTPGPGTYEHHRRTETVNNSNPKWNWRDQSPRKTRTIDPDGGPGTYEEHRYFNDSVRGIEFGYRREQPVD